MSDLHYCPHLKDVPVYKAGSSVLAGFDKPIKLSSNENAYGAAPSALEAYNRAGELLFKYPNGDAFLIKDALVERYHIQRDNIICGSGSDNILELLCVCFLNNGDEALYSTHSFPVYGIASRVVGGVPVCVPYKADLSHDIDGLIKACTDRTKLVFLANPDNPTGRHVSRAEVIRLIENVPSSSLVVIDEAYTEFATASDYAPSLDLVEKYPNVAVTRTFSKMFGLAGLRVGWGYLPPIAVDALNRARSPFNVNMPAQYAVSAVLKDTLWQEENLRKNLSVRTVLEDFLAQNGYDYTPSQANFVLVKFQNAAAVDIYLKSQGIIVRHMSGNDMPDYLRFSLGTEADNKALMSALERYKP